MPRRGGADGMSSVSNNFKYMTKNLDLAVHGAYSICNPITTTRRSKRAGLTIAKAFDVPSASLAPLEL